MANEKSIRYVLRMKDGTSAVLGRVRKSIKATAGTVSGLGAGLSRMTIIGTGLSRMFRNVTRAAGAFAKGTIGEFAKFEKGMGEVATITDLSSKEVANLGTQVEKFSRRYAVDATEAAKALYMTISAGVPATNGGAQAFEVMGEAMKFGKAALVDAAGSVDLMTTVLNSYGMKASEASKVTDVLFTTIKLGKTTGEELAGSLGRVTAIANAAGVSIEDLAGSMVVLTRAGLSTEESSTALRQLIASIAKPTEKSKKAIEALGLEMFNQGTLAQKGGIFKVLEELREKAGGNVRALGEVIPNIRALTGALAAAGQEDAIPAILAELTEAAGASEEALGKMTSTFGFNVDQVSESFKVFKVSIGEALTSSGVLKEALNIIRDQLDEWADAVKKSGEDGVGGFSLFIESLVTVWTPQFLDAMAAMVRSFTQVGGTGRFAVSNLVSSFDILSTIVRKSLEGWQDFGFIVQGVWYKLSGNEDALFRMDLAYQNILKLRDAAKEAREEFDQKNVANLADGFDPAGAGELVAKGILATADALRDAGEAAAEKARLVELGTRRDEEAAEALNPLLAAQERVTKAWEDYETANEAVNRAHASNEMAESMGAAVIVEEEWLLRLYATHAEKFNALRAARDDVAKLTPKEITLPEIDVSSVEKVEDVVDHVGQAVKVVEERVTGVDAAMAKLIARAKAIVEPIIEQNKMTAELNEEIRITKRLMEVEGESTEEILATRERITAEENARARAVSNGLPDVEAYVDLSLQSYDLSVLANLEEERRLELIRERVEAEQEAVAEYERSIEAMASTAQSGFQDIFAEWMAGQQSISDGFESFGEGLRLSLSNAFLEPLIGAESFVNELFKGLFDWAAQLGKALADTIKGWFAEKAAQRTLDATVGTATHAATATATAATNMAAVATMMPGLSAAATAALIASFGGAAGAAALLPGLLASGAAQGAAFVALARGGFIDKPTFALVGEDGAETVIPETKTGRSKELLQDLFVRRPELVPNVEKVLPSSGRFGTTNSTSNSNVVNITVNGGGSDASFEDLASDIADEVDRALGRRIGR